MILLVFATLKEMKAALSFVQNVPTLGQGESAEIVVPGYDRPTTVLVTGLTVINTSFHLGRLIGAGDVEGVVNAGTAGSFYMQDLPLGSIAVVNGEYWPEYGLRTLFKVDPTGLGFSLWDGHSDPIFDRVELDPDDNARRMGLSLDDGWSRRACATVSGVSGSEEVAGRLRDNMPIQMENMEGFAAALICRQQGLPFLEIRTISNAVGSRRADDWDIGRALTALGDGFQTLFGASRQ